MEHTFESLCELYPDLKTIKKIKVDRISCDRDGFCSVFFNEYAVRKVYIQSAMGRKGEISGSPDYEWHRSIIIDHFMQLASKDWHKYNEKGMFDEDITMEEERFRAHNKALETARLLRKELLW